MIVVVWEDANNCINSIVNTLTDKFPKDARYYLSKKPQASEIELLTRPPFVFIGWLIYANKKTNVKLLAQLDDCRSQNIILIRVTNQNDYKDLESKISSLNTKFFDNHTVSKEQLIKWISSELSCPEDVAKYLYNRTGGFMREIVFAVQNLKRTGKEVTRKLIRELVAKNQNASMLDVVEYLIGITSAHTSKSDIFATIYRFRYAESWLVETIKTELDNYIKVYKLVASCTLTIQNYSEQALLLQDDEIQKMPNWKLKRMILNYGKTSLERIILTRSMFESMGKSYFNLIKLIQLLSIGGN